MDLETRTVRKVTTRLIPMLIVLYVLAFVDRSVISVAKLTMSPDIGLSEAAYGLGAGLFFIGYFIFEVPSNLLMHRFGAKAWFARILITWGLFTALMAFAWDPTSFYVLRFLLGAAEAGFFPGVIYYLTLWYPAKQRKTATSQFVLSQPIALLLMSPIAGLLISITWFDIAGWKWLFILAGGVAMLGAIPCLLWLPNAPKDVDWLEPEEAAWITETLEKERVELGQTDHKNPLRALLDKRVLLLSFVYVLLCTGVYGLSLWLPTVVKAFGDLSNTQTGLISAIPYVFAILGLLATGRLLRTYKGSYLPLAVVFAASGVGLIISTFAGSPVMQLVFLSATAFFLFPTTPCFWPIPNSILVGATAAAGIAAINSVGNLGGFIGPYIVGWLTQVTGDTRAGMVFLASALILGALMVGVVKSTLGKASSSDAEVLSAK